MKFYVSRYTQWKTKEIPEAQYICELTSINIFMDGYLGPIKDYQDGNLSINSNLCLGRQSVYFLIGKANINWKLICTQNQSNLRANSSHPPIASAVYILCFGKGCISVKLWLKVMRICWSQFRLYISRWLMHFLTDKARAVQFHANTTLGLFSRTIRTFKISFVFRKNSCVSGTSAVLSLKPSVIDWIGYVVWMSK